MCEINYTLSAPKIIILNTFFEPYWTKYAIDLGVKGFLVKENGGNDLVNAIRQVDCGQVFLPRNGKAWDSDSILSVREYDVLSLLALGHTSKEIGEILQISHRTVEHHRAKLYNKLNINDIPGLTRYAVRCGIVDPVAR